MKIRLGFVSNSSSASFCVSLDKITARDAAILLDYGKKATDENDHCDYWDIHIDDIRGMIVGFTIMDNDGLWEYLKKNNVNVGIFMVEGD